jgi:AcrR family transcriptional regulator
VSERIARRRRRTRGEIIDAAWKLAERDGLVSLTLRDLASEVGMRAPSLYSYFDGKAAIYDAMFAEGYRDLDTALTEVVARTDTDPADDPHGWLVSGVRAWLAFCQASLPRYQLMFTRVIPGWEPSPEAYAISVDSFARMRGWLASAGITDDHDVDLWTALVAGLAAQQIANEPAGTRWIDLTERTVTMFLHAVESRGAP